MTKLTFYTPRSPLTRLLAPLVANAASYFPPEALRPVVRPCVRASNHSRRPALRRHASRTINLIVGDGMITSAARCSGSPPAGASSARCVAASTSCCYPGKSRSRERGSPSTSPPARNYSVAWTSTITGHGLPT